MSQTLHAHHPKRLPMLAAIPQYIVTFDEALSRLTLEQCKSMVVKFGKHTGKSLGEIALIAPQDVNWIKEKYNGNDYILRAAATKLVEEALQRAS